MACSCIILLTKIITYLNLSSTRRFIGASSLFFSPPFSPARLPIFPVFAKLRAVGRKTCTLACSALPPLLLGPGPGLSLPLSPWTHVPPHQETNPLTFPLPSRGFAIIDSDSLIVSMIPVDSYIIRE